MKFLQKTWVAVVITAAMIVAAVAIGLSTVSYTHLDVYKRQL